MSEVTATETKCPYCLLRQAKERFVPIDEDTCFVNRSCDDCQQGVDKAVKRTRLVQRGLLKKYDSTPVKQFLNPLTNVVKVLYNGLLR